jgi:hypothetical protein
LLASLQISDTLVFAQGGHLWVVISDSTKHAGLSIIVNFTSDIFRAGKDCELNVGDHQWIKKKCYVSFGDARMITPKKESTIMKLIASGTIKTHFPVKSSVLQKIVAAAKISKAMPEEIKCYL